MNTGLNFDSSVCLFFARFRQTFVLKNGERKTFIINDLTHLEIYDVSLLATGRPASPALASRDTDTVTLTLTFA